MVSNTLPVSIQSLRNDAPANASNCQQHSTLFLALHYSYLAILSHRIRLWH